MSRIDELADCKLFGVFPDTWIGILYDITPTIVVVARRQAGVEAVPRKLPAIVQPETELAFFLQHDDATVTTRWKSQGISKPAVASLRAYLSGRRRFVVADPEFMHELATTPIDIVAAKYGLHVNYLMPLRAQVVPKNTYLSKSISRALTYLRSKPAGFTFSPADLAIAVFHSNKDRKAVSNNTVARLVRRGYARHVGHGSYEWVPFLGAS